MSLGSMFGAGGDAGFLGLPEVDESTIDGIAAGAAVIGAPCATPYASVGPYGKSAPAAIRSASHAYSAIRGHHNFDLGGPAVPEGFVAVDLGDVAWDEHDHEGNRDRIRATTSRVLAAGAVPIVLGGDDSIPIPVVQAYEGRGPLTILQIDAHIDWRDEVQGERWGLSSTMRRSSELPHVGAMVQVGRRGLGSARPADLAAADARGVRFVGAHDVHRHGTAPAIDAIPEGPDVFVTIDVDGLDPAIVPGVIGPEPGGLSYFQVIELIDGAAARGRIAGVAVVEFVPERDVNGLGALTAFRLAAHALGRIAQQATRPA